MMAAAMVIITQIRTGKKWRHVTPPPPPPHPAPYYSLFRFAYYLTYIGLAWKLLSFPFSLSLTY